MIFVGRYAGEPALLKSPRDDLSAEAFETTVFRISHALELNCEMSLRVICPVHYQARILFL